MSPSSSDFLPKSPLRLLDKASYDAPEDLMGLSTVEWAVSVEILNTQIILSEPRSNTLLLSNSNSSPPEVLAVERFKPERKRRGKELFQDSVGDCTLESIHIKAKLNEVKEPIRKGGISIRRDPVVREMLSDALEVPRKNSSSISFSHSLAGEAGPTCPPPYQ